MLSTNPSSLYSNNTSICSFMVLFSFPANLTEFAFSGLFVNAICAMLFNSFFAQEIPRLSVGHLELTPLVRFETFI